MKLKLCFPGILLSNGKVLQYTDNSSNDNNQDVNDSLQYASAGEWITSVVIVLMLALILITATCQAQEKPIATGLKVGDQVPDITITNIINYPTKTAKISDFKGKLLILDFWATFCSSCLSHFSMEDSLQAELGDKVQFLLVNSWDSGDNESKIVRTMRRFDRPGHLFGLPSVTHDTILSELFPHHFLPHYVWIDENGKIAAFTSGDELTQKSILTFSQQHQAPKYQKNDFNPEVPLFTSDQLPVNNLKHYSIFLKGKIDGIGGSGPRIINDTVRGFRSINNDLMLVYRLIAENKFPGIGEERIRLNVKDSSRLFYKPSSGSRMDWERENFCSLELLVPPEKVVDLYDLILEELNKYTSYNGSIESHETDCWILERTDSKDRLATKGGKYLNKLGDSTNSRLNNASVFELCVFISELSPTKIVIDKTGYTHKVDLNFNCAVSDIEDLKKLLKSKGLKLYKIKQKLDLLVIKDK